MGFGGGGGGATLPHKHTLIPNDGSPLDFVNTTIGSMSANSITYSDGAALQELVIGAPTEVLTVSGLNVPEWAVIPPAPSGGKMILLEDQQASGAGATPINWTPGTPLSFADYSYLRFVIKADETLSGLNHFWGEVNGLSANYGIQGQGQAGGVVTVLNNYLGTTAWNFWDPLSQNVSSWFFTMDLALPTTAGSDNMNMQFQTNSTTGVYVGGGGHVTGTGATFTEIEFNFQGAASVRSTEFQAYGIQT